MHKNKILKIIGVISSFILFLSTVNAQFEIGHTTQMFFDNDRNRNVETEIFYPANDVGDDVPLAVGNFPVIVLGHGFVMSWESYESYWKELVPLGYVVCLANTENSLAPNHEDFGLDLSFIAAQMQLENNINTSLFFNSISFKTALMGHSMGGGAAFLGAENNTEITTLIGLAAAETNPSAISAASNINIPTLMFSGEADCVTPPDMHQDLMYENLASDCKTQINIVNGGHCYFADDNFNCTLGESFCAPQINITRLEQLSVTIDFLKLWLDYMLYENQNAFTTFNDSLQTSNRINFAQSCTATSLEDIDKDELKIFPNPVYNKINIEFTSGNKRGKLLIYNLLGEEVCNKEIDNYEFEIDVSHFQNGTYFVRLYGDDYKYSGRFIKNGK